MERKRKDILAFPSIVRLSCIIPDCYYWPSDTKTRPVSVWKDRKKLSRNARVEGTMENAQILNCQKYYNWQLSACIFKYIHNKTKEEWGNKVKKMSQVIVLVSRKFFLLYVCCLVCDLSSLVWSLPLLSISLLL